MSRRLLGIAALLLVASARRADGVARLDYPGGGLERRRVEALLAPALRAPRDSSALATSLAKLVAGLEDQGYLDARATAWWDSSAVPALHLALGVGRRQRLASLAIDTPAREDSARFAASLGLLPGDWFSASALSTAIARAVREAADAGHPYATLGVVALRWDSGGAQVRMSGALGPAVTVTRVRVEGLHGTRAAVTERAMGRLADAPFNLAAATAARERLAKLGLFRSVEYEGLEGEGDWRRGQLVYRVVEPHYNRFEGAVGMQGERRAVGLASLALDNLAGTGRALALRWESRGRGVAEFSARYAEPLLLGAPLRAELTLEQQNQDTIYTRTRWGGRLQFTLSDRERLAAGYTQERVVQAQGDLEEADLQTTEFALERDGRDSPIDPRHGVFARLEAAQSFKGEVLRPPGRRSARASAVETFTEWHRSLGSRSGLALELSSAARFSSQRVLPFFERYPLGGATSLRGYDEQAFRVDRYALSRLEWRWFLGTGGERVFVFWDHAWMATRLPRPQGGDFLETVHRDGVGFGLRLDAAGGTVGVDYGLEPGQAPLDGKIHLRLISSF